MHMSSIIVSLQANAASLVEVIHLQSLTRFLPGFLLSEVSGVADSM